LCVEEKGPPLPLFQNPYTSISVLTSGNRRKWVEIRVKNTPLECMGKNFNKGFKGDYGVNA
jgi:hypothetical protein